jgi:hypothetical protein
LPNSILATQERRAELEAYLYALTNANIQTIQEVLVMEGLPFDQWVEATGLAAKWEARGEARGKKAPGKRP